MVKVTLWIVMTHEKHAPQTQFHTQAAQSVLPLLSVLKVRKQTQRDRPHLTYNITDECF